MDTILLSDLIKQAKDLMLKREYSKKSIVNYSTVWNQYLKYCSEKNITNYSQILRKEFLIEHYQINLDGNITKHQRSIIKRLDILDNIYKGRDFHYKIANEEIIPQANKNIYNEYINYLINVLKLANSTIINRKHSILKFLNYIGNTELIYTKSDTVYEFITSLNQYRLSSKTLIAENIKHFFNYLYNNKITNITGNQLFPIIKQNKKSSLISYYSEEELKSILSNVDISQKTGKRDYLVLLLAIQLGIRANDLIHLKLENIKWHTNKIIFEQSKTKTIIELPMSEDIKLALCDYLKNVRPTSNEPYIFINLLAPHMPYKSNNFYYISKKYICIAKLNKNDRKKGLHSMRHSLASNLLLNNTPISIITGILGHSNANVTNTYLSIDINKLRQMSLEVPNER